MSEQTYILLDSTNTPLAKGIMISPPGAEKIQIRVLDDMADIVASHEVIQLIGMGVGTTSLRCLLVQCRRDMLVLDRMEILNPEMRRNLRIPVVFDSFLYPVKGQWKGRRSIRAIDLSCGGIAFYSDQGLEIGEQAEVVIPITTAPLILQIQILRIQELKHGRTYYAAKFINMCFDEEQMVCEAVFGIELDNHSRTTRKERMG